MRKIFHFVDPFVSVILVRILIPHIIPMLGLLSPAASFRVQPPHYAPFLNRFSGAGGLMVGAW